MRSLEKKLAMVAIDDDEHHEKMSDKLLDAKELVMTMKRKELKYYSFHDNIIPKTPLFEHAADEVDLRSHPSLKGGICSWMFSVVDHIGYSRESVSRSMSLFDRYVRTKGYILKCHHVELCSITTLYISIKIHEKNPINTRRLCNLIHSRFRPNDIEKMELEILTALSWMVHPPTVVDFIYYLILFLPKQVCSTTRQDLFESSKYMAELSVYDPFFERVKPSTVALAAVYNSLEGSNVSPRYRGIFFMNLHQNFDLHVGEMEVIRSRDRLRLLLNGPMSDEDTVHLQQCNQKIKRANPSPKRKHLRCVSLDSVTEL